MWNVQRPSFGFVLTLAGRFSLDDVRAFGVACRSELDKPLPDGWGVVVDMRDLVPLGEKEQVSLVDIQKAFKARGMTRSVVVLKDAIATMQQRRLARQSGIDKWERYINASVVLDWQSAAKKWLTSSTEPPL